jgi:hypothetical protein
VNAPAETKFEGWALVELMGHRSFPAYITETSVAGTPFLRCEVPWSDPAKGFRETHLHRPDVLYGLHPCTEEAAREAAKQREYVPPSSSYYLDAAPQDDDPPEDDDEPEDPEGPPI